ncbi:hypothetical protein ABID56_002606 [Alkalibacillus flavidus]|uniref:Uncharacterized protein n=1 Tax=Alkalibacillus flavidus TaxID=546021 RepID=A0ABV2KY05_9BACI
MTPEEYENEIERLKEIIGSWRRKAQEKNPVRYTIFKEDLVMDDYSSHKWHKRCYIADFIPGDLEIGKVVDELVQSGFLYELEPYKLRNVSYSTKFKAWIVEVMAPIQHDGFDKYMQMYWQRRAERTERL